MKPRTPSSMTLSLFSIKWVWAATLLCPMVIQAQDLWPDTVEVIKLEFKSLPPLVQKDSSQLPRPPSFNLYLYPPYVIHQNSFMDDYSMYLLIRPDLGRMFHCRDSEEGVSFYPAYWHNARDPVTNLTWRKDTIRGFPVFETYRYESGDTLRSWNTDVFQLNHSGYAFMKGIPLYIENLMYGHKYRTVLHRADTVRLSSRLFDPSRSHAPVTFDSDYRNFSYSPSLKMHTPDLIRYSMPNFSGKDVVTGKRWSIKSLQGRIVPLIFINYTQIGRLPGHVREWLLSVSQAPDIAPLIFCLDSKKEIAAVLENDPDLNVLPHIPITGPEYIRIAGDVPLYYVILDQGGVIDFHRNGFQLYSTEEMTGTIDRLRRIWKKGTDTGAQDH